MMNTSEDRMLFSVDGAAALTQAFKREALGSFQSDSRLLSPISQQRTQTGSLK